VFVDKGRPLSEYTTFTTSDRNELESWVWEQMHLLGVTFVNRHDHPVELYWINGGSGKLLYTLQPGESIHENTMLSHEFYARDARVDWWEGSPGRNKLSENSAMGSWKILSDPVSDVDGNTIYIRSDCFDLSGHCEWWAAAPRHECGKNPGFMKETCPKTCKLCTEGGSENVPVFGPTRYNESSSDDLSSRNGDEL
jgi:hypothetical protein